MAFGYKETFRNSKTRTVALSLDVIADGSGLSCEEAAEALQSLVSLKIVSYYSDADGKAIYSFALVEMLYAFEIYRLSKILIDEKVWLVLRD